MSPLSFRQVGTALWVVVAMLLIPSKVAIWLDSEGRATLTNRLQLPDPGAIELSPTDLRLRWQGHWVGEPLIERYDSSAEDDRFHRVLLGSLADIERGEMRRGLRGLRRLHRDYPQRPEPAWLLAQVERRRGRLESARDALDMALSLAAAMPSQWREAAEQLRGEIDLELAHAQRAYVDGAPIRVQETEHFRLTYDHQFAGRSFGEDALAMLERVRMRLDERLGRRLERPLEVRLYTRTQYLKSYEHRFGFATVGFYDGAIHVVSQRHPESDLFALLIHEYAHALFEGALGSHQPFFLNEGIADREEERARGRDRLSRGEWRQLLDALRDRAWIPLGSLVQDFGGLEGERALLAYLESRAVVELIEDSVPGATGRWLDRCAAGEAWEDALEAETGWRTDDLEAALIGDVTARFPQDPLAEFTPPVPSNRNRPGSPSDTHAGGRPFPSPAGAHVPA